MNHDLQELYDTFPCFRAVSAEEWAAAQPRLKTFPPAAGLFRAEEAAKYALFLIAGTVRISTIAESGREMIANRLSPGDICAFMVLSGLSERDYPGAMTAETEVTALFVEKSSFLRWIQEYAPVRNAVFGNMMDGLIRMSELLTGKIAKPLDARLAELLLRLTSEQQPTIRSTHQQLSAELGSAREVISRVLSRMHKKGWIATGRGRISVLEREALSSFVGDLVTEL
ncbi:Crp/Fnr family transcriptional regulator [Paenibacillus piri]|uniref:Crp/Fnr family transcriptional regulator n=1 Tax=Paenibacillus piri TaxID=2547395 RepID=A0A4R5KED0_9BACL|nr:Crp/Fnr family transcriptional regulator [Paenibacillus piri]TDF93729.1 Crp/Fnr family transcriptional regulator [Paenibacillus piri]